MSLFFELNAKLKLPLWYYEVRDRAVTFYPPFKDVPGLNLFFEAFFVWRIFFKTEGVI